MYKTNVLIGGTYAKLPVNGQRVLSVKTNDKYSALWSILLKRFPAKTSQTPAKYKRRLDNMKINCIDFSDSLKSEDQTEIETKKNNNPKVFELKVDNGKPKLLPICISDFVFFGEGPAGGQKDANDLLWFKNLYCSTKMLLVFLSIHNMAHLWTKCLSWFHRMDRLKLHQLLCPMNQTCKMIFFEKNWLLFEPKKPKLLVKLFQL